MSTPTKVSLRQLSGENTLPMGVDTVAFIITMLVMMSETVNAVAGILAAFAVAAVVHAVQMTWLVYVQFDDTAITIVRPWRRRRVEWRHIAGLVYTELGPPGGVSGSGSYRLRLVLTDNEPPVAAPFQAKASPFQRDPRVPKGT